MKSPQPGARSTDTRSQSTWATFTQPRMLAMLALGFSAGLPFMLVFNTMSAWLAQSGVKLATVGMFSYVGLAYTVKFAWAPVVDRWRLPVIGLALGQRRSWMLLAQAGIFVGLLLISGSHPATHVLRLAGFALLVAFSAATQDIVVDAWRIESAPADQQGAMAASYQFGYRTAIMVGSAGALWIAADYGWQMAYTTMAILVTIGILTTLFVKEPLRRAPQSSVLTEQRVIDWLAHRAHWPKSLQSAGAWVLGAVVCPFLDFFARFGWRLGLLIFAFISVYRLTDYTMGVVANPFYLHLGITLKQIAAVAKIYGTGMTLVGVVVGGLAVTRLGRTWSLLLGSVLIIVSNLAYAEFAHLGQPSVLGLATIISIDNFAQGVHGTALIAFMSTLTSASYTATQYAVLSSAYALPGKLLMGTSGLVAAAIGFPTFFIYTAALSVPGLLLLYVLARRGYVEQLRQAG